MKGHSKIKILGIDFINTTPQNVVDILKGGGLLGVPAAPALINIKKDPDYYKALLSADVVIPDSAYMVLLWNIFNHNKIKRVSGLKLLTTFLSDVEVKSSSSLFLVNPRAEDATYNLNYLNSCGFTVSDEVCYTAPMYNKNYVKDGILLGIIEKKKPKYIVINLGGGTQEKLGQYLKNNLSYKPAIICTGAAIAFITGSQAKIPVWGDRFYLGWLFRCMQNPRLYVPRYFKAFQLAVYMFHYRQPLAKIIRIYRKAASVK